MLAGLAVWPGLFFAFGSSQSVAGLVVAVMLFVLGVVVVSLILLFALLDTAFALVERLARTGHEARLHVYLFAVLAVL